MDSQQDGNQQQVEDFQENPETLLRTDAASPESLAKTPTRTFPPTLMQPQIAFLANATSDENGGSMTGSFVLLPSPYGSSSQMRAPSPVDRQLQNDRTTRQQRHGQATNTHRNVGGGGGGNVDPFVAAMLANSSNSFPPLSTDRKLSDSHSEVGRDGGNMLGSNSSSVSSPPNRSPSDSNLEVGSDDGGNVDPFVAAMLREQPTTDPSLPLNPNPNRSIFSNMSPLTESGGFQQNLSSRANDADPEANTPTTNQADVAPSGLTKTTPTHVPLRQSYRTRRRNRAAQQKQKKKKKNTHYSHHNITLPPHHRKTKSQVTDTVAQQQPRPVQLPPHHRAHATQVWTGEESDPYVPETVVLNGIPIIVNDDSTLGGFSHRPMQQTSSASASLKQALSASQIQQTPTIDPRRRPGIPYYHRRTDTNMTVVPVSRRRVSGLEPDRSNSLPSVHYLRDGGQGLRNHLREFVRDSLSMSIIDYEQIERVKMMHHRFSEGSKFTFNYNTLLLTASVIAGLGLASNSSTTVIASMLVSPIMGPVVGMAYGATIHDFRLFKRALFTETLSLIFCVVIGMILGLCMGPTELAQDWPTDEMQVRGTWQNFFVALPVAFFSGLGVAVGLLDDQVSSLVGVAISASLLPPAVNAGILFVAYLFFDKDWWHDYVQPTLSPEVLPANFTQTPGIDVPDEELPDYTTRSDYREAGLISLLLTVANIVLVAAASMLMFRMKERLPIPSKKVFWDDLGTARKIYRNLAVMSNEDGSQSQASSGAVENLLEISSNPSKSRSSENSAKSSIISGRFSEFQREIDLGVPEGDEVDGEVTSQQNEVIDLRPSV